MAYDNATSFIFSSRAFAQNATGGTASVNKQIYSRIEFPAKLKVFSGQTSRQRPETKLTKEHGVKQLSSHVTRKASAQGGRSSV